MPREKRAALLASLRRINAIDSGESSDNDDDITTTADPTGVALVTDSSDADSSSDDRATTATSGSDRTTPTSASSLAGNGWRGIPIGHFNQLRGRIRQRNIFHENPGVKPAIRSVIHSPYDAWKCLIDETMLRHIHRSTIGYGRTVDPEFDIELADLESFIGLQYARGVYGNTHSISFLWSQKFGCKLFSDTMSRNKFCLMKRFIRFDNRQARGERILLDKFTHIRDIFQAFAENCRKSFTPGMSVCIDEQLMPLKTRCKFITYMPNKPDKYGIKFWLLVDNTTKYVYNIIPYLGKPEVVAAKALAHDVVISLMGPLLNKGYNVTVDNFFPSMPLIKELNTRHTSLVGTVRPNRKGLPPNLPNTNLPLHASQFFWNDDDQCLLVKYQCKQQKAAYVISTMHVNPLVDETTEKKKPFVILFYNKNKCGVDVSDSMLRFHTTRCATRRWPLAVWQNILDIAALNAWVVFKSSTGSSISRKDFLLQLTSELCHIQMPQAAAQLGPAAQPVQTTRGKCSTKGCKNKTSVMCNACKKLLCGTHCPNDVVKIHITTCEECINN